MPQQNNIGLTPQIQRVVASPTDVYTRTNAGQSLGQLAEGLTQFAPALARFTDAKFEQQSAADRLEGENTARTLQESGKTYRDAIEQGLIEPHHSPWFRIGAYETFGRTSAHKYSGDLQVALANSPVAESTDPKDFDQFERDFRAKWSKENLGETQDPYFQNAFGSQADALVSGERSNFTQNAGTRLVKQAGESFHAEVFSIVQDGIAKHLSGDDLAAQVNLSLSRQIAAGMNKGIANQLAASAITQVAKRLNDTTALDVMDKIKLGSGTLAGTSYGSQARELAENEIASVNQTRYAAEEMRETKQKQKNTDAVVSDAVAAFAAAPDARSVDISSFVERMRRVNPEKAETILKMREAWADDSFKGDHEQTDRLFEGVFSGSTGMSQLNSALSSRMIAKSDYVEMANLVRRREKEDNKVTKLFNDDGFKEGKDRLQKLFVVQFGAIEKPGNSQRYENAISEFTTQYFRWKDGPGDGATPIQTNEFLTNTIRGKILKFGDGGQNSDRDKIPNPNTGPTPTDWKKEPVTDMSTLANAEKEWSEFTRGARHSLTKTTLDLINSSGVNLSDHNAVAQFFKTQKRVGPQFLAPDAR